MKRVTISICLLLCVAAFTLGQSNNKKVEEEILKLEQELAQARVKNDLAAPQRLMADNYAMTLFIPPQHMSKAELLASRQNYTVTERTQEEANVRVYGNTAIYTARWKETRKREEGRVTNASGRLTDTWVKLNGRWQLVASHASPDIDLSKCRN
jgi:ketosteroid isomerase-like protein